MHHWDNTALQVYECFCICDDGRYRNANQQDLWGHAQKSNSARVFEQFRMFARVCMPNRGEKTSHQTDDDTDFCKTQMIYQSCRSWDACWSSWWLTEGSADGWTGGCSIMGFISNFFFSLRTACLGMTSRRKLPPFQTVADTLKIWKITCILYERNIGTARAMVATVNAAWSSMYMVGRFWSPNIPLSLHHMLFAFCAFFESSLMNADGHTGPQMGGNYGSKEIILKRTNIQHARTYNKIGLTLLVNHSKHNEDSRRAEKNTKHRIHNRGSSILCGKNNNNNLVENITFLQEIIAVES